MADVEAGLIIEGPHTLDAAPQAVAIASPPTALTHPRKQGPPRCRLTRGSAEFFRAFGGPDGDRVPSRTWRMCISLNSAGPLAPPILLPVKRISAANL